MKRALLKHYQSVGIVHQSSSMPHLPIFEETPDVFMKKLHVRSGKDEFRKTTQIRTSPNLFEVFPSF